MNTFWNQKQWLWFVALLIVAGVLIWFGPKLYSQYQNRPQSHTLFGQIKEVKDNEILISGVHIIDGTQKISDHNSSQDITVKFNTNTKFVKTVWHMPPREEWEKVRANFDFNSVKKDQQSGLLDDLKVTVGIPITVKTSNNTINRKTVTASEIGYNIYLYGNK